MVWFSALFSRFLHTVFKHSSVVRQECFVSHARISKDHLVVIVSEYEVGCETYIFHGSCFCGYGDSIYNVLACAHP